MPVLGLRCSSNGFVRAEFHIVLISGDVSLSLIQVDSFLARWK